MKKDTKNSAAIIIAVVTAILLGLLGVVALMENNQTNSGDNDGSGEVLELAPRANCDVEECMELLEPKMTLTEANEVMGFEGEKADTEEKYTWQLSDKKKITIEYKDGSGTVKGTYDKDKIKDSTFKIAKGYELQNLLREGTSYTYDETVEQFGGVAGHLEVKSPTSKMYIWVNDDGLVFRATFSDSINGKTSIISIR